LRERHEPSCSLTKHSPGLPPKNILMAPAIGDAVTGEATVQPTYRYRKSPWHATEAEKRRPSESVIDDLVWIQVQPRQAVAAHISMESDVLAIAAFVAAAEYGFDPVNAKPAEA